MDPVWPIRRQITGVTAETSGGRRADDPFVLARVSPQTMNELSIGLGLMFLLCGCVSGGGESEGSTTAAGSTSDGGGTTSESGSDASTGGVDSSSGGGSSTGGERGSESSGGSCGGVECAEDEECVEEACVPIAPPPMCDAPVVPSDPGCAACIARSCCDVVQACYGDGSTTEATSCAELRSCVDLECAESETLEEFETCAIDDCGATEEDLDALFATFACVGECVVEIGPGQEESCGVAPR